MEYQVPQFIEVEDKIFGPFTFKQFIYIAGGIGMCAIAFVYLPLIFAILVALPVAGIAGALAFYRVNNKPFLDVVEAGFTYITGGKLYLWRKDEVVGQQGPAPAPEPVVKPPQKLGLTSGKLQDLAWSLDIKNQGEPE